MRRLAYRRRTGAIIGVALLAGTACGTRLPNSSFVGPAGSGASGVSGTGAGGANQGDGGPGGGGSGGGQTPGTPGAGGAPGAAGAPGASGAGPGAAAGAGPGTGGATPGGARGSVANFASDVGVTANSITIGNVTGLNGFLGPDAFGPTLWGLQAFVAATNAQGGIDGRKLVLDTCDDNQDGAQNLACAEKVVGQDHAFALLADNSLTTAPSAHYEFTQGVPDLGLPLNNGYYKYPNMFSIYGTPYPRDGTQVGDHGTEWTPTGVWHYFKHVTGVNKAAYFFYSQASSQQAAYGYEQQASAEGIQPVYESGGHAGENLEAPNWDADVLAMKSKGADGVIDAVDVAANEKICASMDRYGVHVKAKVSTIEVWSQQVGTSAWSAPCRDSVYVNSVSVPYSETQVPIIAQFRHDYSTYSPGKLLHQWAAEGYGIGLVFKDAVTAMGANVTRKGFIGWLDAIPAPPPLGNGNYTAHGLFTPFSWKPRTNPVVTNNCNSFAQWQDSAQTFVNRSPSGEFACYMVNEVGSPFSNDGS